MVSSKADLTVEEPDIENRIDPETVDSDASVGDIHIKWKEEEDNGGVLSGPRIFKASLDRYFLLAKIVSVDSIFGQAHQFFSF